MSLTDKKGKKRPLVDGLSTEEKQDEIIENQTDGTQKTGLVYTKNPDGKQSDVTNQDPLPTDGDAVYCKDIWEAQSVMGDFSGDVCDLFNDLHSTVINSTSDNPKTLLIHFNRTVVSNAIGIGSFSGNFSNVKIEIGNSGGIFTTVVDESSSNTDYTSRTFQLPITAGFNAVRFTFHTTDTVTLSNLVILKSRSNISRIQAKSELTGEVEDTTSYRGSLNVNNAWVNRKIVNESFHQHDSAVTSPTTGIDEGDTAVTVDSVVGFSVADEVKIEEDVASVGIQEIGVLTITDITGLVITFDRPISNDYTTAATIERVVTNMAVVGTLANPVSFEIDPPLGTVWQFTRILFNITDQTVMDDAKFGGIPALTNGVSLRATTAAGRTVTFANWKSNSDMKLDMFDINYSSKAPAGFYGLTGRWTFTKAEVVAELDGDASPVQKLEVLIQDDLTDLDTFLMRGQGRVFSP